MPMPFNPPSNVLYQLMQDLYGLAKGVVATAEDKVGQVGDRTPVGTTMALIEQGSNTYSAIHSRLHESQKRALAIIHRLNSVYLDEDVHVEELGELTVSRKDFLGSLDVVPVSDPTIFSEAQRFAQSQAVLQMAQGDTANPNIPWNQVHVRRRMLKQMRIENIDELLPAPKKELTGDLLTENTQASRGYPLKASKEQNHLAHIQGHLAYIESPLQLANPLVPGPFLLGMLGHVNEHIQLLIAQRTELLVQSMEAMGMPAEEPQLAEATIQANAELSQMLGPVLEQLAKLQQMIQQQKMPQPQPDPSVQASLQIAQMDTQRKAQADQVDAQISQAKLQSEQQIAQAELSLKQMDQQFRQAMEARDQQFQQQLGQLQLILDDRNQQLSHQVEVENNSRDNHQKQVTEILKNRDDNETKVLIERLKASLQGQTLDGELTSQTIDLMKEILNGQSSPE